MAFVEYHKPCHLCDSSDAVSINEDGSGYCFSCNERIHDYYGNRDYEDNVQDFKTYKNNTMNSNEGVFQTIKDRNISLDTAKKYGVKVVADSSGQIKQHQYPYYIANEMVGTKIRDCLNKDFSWRGSPKGTMLFGQQLFSKGGKFLTLVEGECDAMAAYELMGSKWPVVSVKNGAGGAVRDVKDNLEFIESFDSVVNCFDNDKAGKDAAMKVARLLRPGKSKILTLPDDFKDPNDMLKHNRKESFMQCWWGAKTYTPAGVLNISDMEEEYFKRERKESIPYPWHGLNEKLYGMRQGELVTVTGGTGLGKSSVTRELEHWILKHTEDNVGILALEENWQRTVDGLVSIEANKRLYIDQIREELSPEEWKRYFNNLYDGKDRLWIHSHLGAHDIDELFSKLRYMILGCDCKWVIVDHLGMMTSAVAEGDERRAIDSIMTRLRSLVEETGAGMFLVSHLRRIDGNKGHEQGVEVSMSHLRGSNGIGQISDCVIALERNQQADDPVEASTTRMRILKSRYTGDVGLAGHLLYDKDTGRLKEVFVDADDAEIEL